MLIKNVHLADREGLWQILIEDQKIVQICANDEVINYVGEIVDAENGIAYPPFVEPHIHLDATQT
ncbi:cytosine deaminase, partial [Pasteurella multocida subsp. multocida str. Anand1_cattle]